MIKDKVAAVKQAKFILQQRKYRAERLAEINLEKALSNKTFKNNYDKLMNLTWEIGKAEYEKKDTKAIYSEYKKLEDSNKKVLMSINLKPGDLKPQYSCDKCKDSGIYKNGECSCFKSLISELMLENSGITSKTNFKNANMAIWDREVKEENIVLYNKMKKYSEEIAKTKKKLITISGKTGVGKTYLAQCMVNESIEQGNYTIFISAFELNQQFLTYHCANISEKANILEPFLSCDFLVIDDLGTENIFKNVTKEYLYLLLSERLANNRNTLITTNLTIDEIDKIYDGRISSRITDKRNSTTLLMNGSDLRLKK